MRQKLIMFVATGAFLGRIPFAPGTFGTLAGIPFALLLTLMAPKFAVLYVTAVVLFAVYVADEAEKYLKAKDPGCIVIDEIAGYLVTLSVVPVEISTLIAGFFIFRFFDILKPFPARYFETRFTGGAAVVLDDVMAGVLSAPVLWMIDLTGLV